MYQPHPSLPKPLAKRADSSFTVLSMYQPHPSLPKPLAKRADSSFTVPYSFFSGYQVVELG